MLDPHGEENEIIEDLLKGLAYAIKHDSEIPAEELYYLSQTKLQKFIYLSVEEFDLPVTYSWYLAGAMINSNHISINSLENILDNTTSPQQIFSTNQEKGFRHHTKDSADHEGGIRRHTEGESSSGNLFERPPEEKRIIEELTDRNTIAKNSEIERYSKFFSLYIQDVWFSDRYTFLEDFYMKYAPAQYRQLYLSSLELRKIMGSLKEKSRKLSQNTIQASLTNFSNNDRPSEDVFQQKHNINRVLSELRIELMNDRELNECIETLKPFSDILYEVYDSANKEARGEVASSLSELFEKLDAFFYNQVWQHPCLIISMRTASGPSKNLVVEDRKRRLSRFRENYQYQIDKLVVQCTDLGYLSNFEI